MNFSYSGPGLPEALKKSLCDLAETLVVTGYAEAGKPAHVHRMALQDGRTLVIRVDTYEAPARELPGFPSAACPPPP